jgi:subtilisin family serine protease
MCYPIISGAMTVPGYHENMLIMRFRPVIVSHAKTMASCEDSLPEPDGGPALSALQRLEQDGYLKEVTPIGRFNQEFDVPPGKCSLANAILSSQAGDPDTNPTAGAILLNFDSAVDIRALQAVMESDSAVAYSSRVPVRFLSPIGSSLDISSPMPQWNLTRIKLEEARSLSDFKEAEDIRVAILDTGIQVDHPDLKDRITRYTYAHCHHPLPPCPHDICGHGTHVAGIISAHEDHNIGIDGLSKAQLFIWKIFNNQDYQFIFSDTKGLDWFTPLVDPLLYYSALADCLWEGVDVINLSIGGPMPPDNLEEELLTNLKENGTVIVAPMGNERTAGNPVTFPAAFDGVIADGAANAEDDVASFSNCGEHINLSAPGVGIWSTVPTYPGQGYITLSRDNQILTRLSRTVEFAAWDGTTMAAAHVSAAIALLISNRGRMHISTILDLLSKSADKPQKMRGYNWHPDFGVGRLNLLNLLSL